MKIFEHQTRVRALIVARSVADRSHALRGNTYIDALRQRLGGDAERPGLHSHAERGNEK